MLRRQRFGWHRVGFSRKECNLSVWRVAGERLLPGAPPDVEWLSRALQAATDRVLGKAGAKLLLGTVMVV